MKSTNTPLRTRNENQQTLIVQPSPSKTNNWHGEYDNQKPKASCHNIYFEPQGVPQNIKPSPLQSQSIKQNKRCNSIQIAQPMYWQSRATSKKASMYDITSEVQHIFFESEQDQSNVLGNISSRPPLKESSPCRRQVPTNPSTPVKNQTKGRSDGSVKQQNRIQSSKVKERLENNENKSQLNSKRGSYQYESLMDLITQSTRNKGNTHRKEYTDQESERYYQQGHSEKQTTKMSTQASQIHTNRTGYSQDRDTRRVYVKGLETSIFDQERSVKYYGDISTDRSANISGVYKPKKLVSENGRANTSRNGPTISARNQNDNQSSFLKNRSPFEMNEVHDHNIQQILGNLYQNQDRVKKSNKESSSRTPERERSGFNHQQGWEKSPCTSPAQQSRRGNPSRESSSMKRPPQPSPSRNMSNPKSGRSVYDSSVKVAKEKYPEKSFVNSSVKKTPQQYGNSF